MHPEKVEWLDAIFFSPHKFLGGPGSSGILLLIKTSYQNKIPEQRVVALCYGPNPG